MKKLAVMGFFFLCLCSILVSAEEMENKTTTITLYTNLDQTLFPEIKYTSLFKLEVKDKKPCSSKDTFTVFYNISKDASLVKEDFFSKEIGCTTSANTGELAVTETGNYTLCGMVINSSVSFSTNSSCMEFEVIDTSAVSCDINLSFKVNETLFYQNSQSIEFKPQLNDKSFPFVIEYWIEDLFGEMVKSSINTTNTNEKSWKTNIKEQDRVLFLKAVVYPSCNDINLSNNVAEKMFIVTKEEAENSPTSSSAEEPSATESTISISRIAPESISFGEIMDAEMEIYKGTTDKYSISVWVEKEGKVVSEKTKVHLKNKNTLYKFTIPILIDSNCNKKIKDGDAQLVVEGLGVQEEKEFTIEGLDKKLCPEKDNLKTEKGKAEKLETKKQTEIKSTDQSLPLLTQSESHSFPLISEKNPAQDLAGYKGIIVYESTSEKSKNLISWILFIAFGLLSLLLVWRKNFD